jgi:hypothetical protein
MAHSYRFGAVGAGGLITLHSIHHLCNLQKKATCQRTASSPRRNWQIHKRLFKTSARGNRLDSAAPDSNHCPSGMVLLERPNGKHYIFFALESGAQHLGQKEDRPMTLEHTLLSAKAFPSGCAYRGRNSAPDGW